MKRFLMGVLTTLVVGVALGAAVVYAGLFDVAADTPHNSLVYRLIETAREKSIDRQTRDLSVPTNLSDAERVRRGAGNYAAMCASCHLAPGKADTEIRMGLYPMPPDLAQSDETGTDVAARQYWIIKHGIKATACRPGPKAESKMRPSGIWWLFCSGCRHFQPCSTWLWLSQAKAILMVALPA